MGTVNIKETINMNGKKLISNILPGGNWFDVNDSKPDFGKKVVIRVVSDNLTYYEDDEKIMLAEDQKIGVYLADINDSSKGEWAIAPPFPKYDYSPLTNREKISDGSKVTHWRELMDGELDSWNVRFSVTGTYDTLKLSIDSEHEEKLYRSLTHGAAAMRVRANELRYMAHHKQKEDKNADVTDMIDEANKLEDFTTYLYDLQAVIDNNIDIDNGQIVHHDNDVDHRSEFEIVNMFNKLLDEIYRIDNSSWASNSIVVNNVGNIIDTMNYLIRDNELLDSESRLGMLRTGIANMLKDIHYVVDIKNSLTNTSKIEILSGFSKLINELQVLQVGLLDDMKDEEDT